jgi:hypothetical protein
MLQRIKRIKSHVGHFRFLAECENEGQLSGFIERQKDIPSPYAYSPTHGVFVYRGKNVILVETAHKTFDVFEVPASIEIKAEDF